MLLISYEKLAQCFPTLARTNSSDLREAHVQVLEFMRKHVKVYCGVSGKLLKPISMCGLKII